MNKKLIGQSIVNNSVTLLYRVLLNSGEYILQADAQDVEVFVTYLDSKDESTDSEALNVADSIYDTLQKDLLWGKTDNVGYNVKVIVSGSMFPTAGTYLVSPLITLTTAERLTLEPFKVEVVDSYVPAS